MRKPAFLLLLLAYFCPGILGTVASGIGIASGLNSLFGGGGGNSSTPAGGVPYYQPSNQAGTDTAWNSMFGAQQGNDQSGQAGLSGLLQSYNQSMGMNYNPYLQAAQQSGMMSGQQAGMDQSGANMLYGQAQTAQNQGGQVYNAGMQAYQRALDPNQAQYNLNLSQLTDNVNAQQALRGIGTSALGGQEAGNALGNFQINWNTQKMQNQLAALQGLTQANSSANQSNQLMGADLSGASGLMSSGAQAQLAAGQTPMQAQQYANAAPGQASNALFSGVSGLNNLYNQSMGNAAQYMGMGQNAAQAANGTAFNQQNFNAQQQGMGASALAQGLNSFNNSGAGGWLNSMVQPNYGNTAQQNNAQLGDPNSSFVNYPGA